jgi:hypothetical protein
MLAISHAARHEPDADAAVRQLYTRHAQADPRERYARHDLNVFKQLWAWRQAKQQQSLAAGALDDLLTRYRAVNATREDVQTILRSYAVERSVER